MDKMSSKGAKKQEGEVRSVEALRHLIIGEFAKVIEELKEFRKDTSGINVQL